MRLKCGGYLIIDQTEAMAPWTSIPGRLGHRNLDDTIFNTNLKRRRLSLASYGCAIWAGLWFLISSI
ncbi:hypothetical protein ACNKHX_19970 [Shigella flexneri]